MWQGLVTNALEQNFFRPHTSPGREMLLFIPILQIRKLRLRVVMHIPRTRWNLNQGPSDSFPVPADAPWVSRGDLRAGAGCGVQIPRGRVFYTLCHWKRVSSGSASVGAAQACILSSWRLEGDDTQG